MKAQPLYRVLASLVDARRTCKIEGNVEWFGRHGERIEHLVRTGLPSGAGFDNGTTLDLDASTGEKLVFHTSFHHMTESGVYDGWTEHRIVVTPSLVHRFKLHIGGSNRGEIKDLIAQSFEYDLSKEVEA